MRLLGLAAIVVVLVLLLKQQSTGAAASAAAVAPDGGLGDGVNPGQAETETPLADMAQAIFQFEGGKPENINMRNNNPGNLRGAPGQTGTAGGYATFATFGDGWTALENWIRNFATKNPDADFYDMMNVYAPASDNNKPNAYAEYVAQHSGADPTQTISGLLGLS